MKTRRTKRNRSPIKPFVNATAFVTVPGDMITTRGVRGRTVVKRILSGDGKRRLQTARLVAPATQQPAPKDGRPIFVNRAYTGVARSKVYPYHSPLRGGAPIVPDVSVSFLGGLTKRVKTVLVGA